MIGCRVLPPDAGSPLRRRCSSTILERRFASRFGCQGTGATKTSTLPELYTASRPIPSSRQILTTLNRSGLRPSFPAQPICYRPRSASLALPTARPTLPSAGLRHRGQVDLAIPSVPSSKHGADLPGKFSRLPCAAAGSTLCALDGYGLCDSLPACPTLAPHIRFLSISSHFCSTLPSDPALRRQPLRFAIPSPPSG